ncbi:hypothetical protein AVEN_100665-1 [Araneus ventricosus]|uniref:Uncharacterized protein n=1 Tax=Araneus ventricosus TaxID=182803 RepID=A0A4Y2S4S0_ARAVE|nr:hypothetical protein AVEN_100665-1 [Araneus ventricosus]
MTAETFRYSPNWRRIFFGLLMSTCLSIHDRGGLEVRSRLWSRRIQVRNPVPLKIRHVLSLLHVNSIDTGSSLQAKNGGRSNIIVKFPPILLSVIDFTPASSLEWLSQKGLGNRGGVS